MLVAATLWATAGVAPALAQQPGTPPPAVLVQAAEMKPIADQAEFIGRAEAVDKVDLRARVKGFLGSRQFEAGADVKEGQVVYLIEPETYQATVDQRMAQRAAAQAALVNAENQFKRAAELLRTNTGTQVTYDQRLSDQLQAKAQLEEASALLREAELQLSYTKIKSPITGRIGRSTFSPGNLVGPDSGVLATVVREHPMYVLFPVTQLDLIEARRGVGPAGNGSDIVVRLRLADGSIYPEKGAINFLDVTVDPKTDTQLVRATFPNANNWLTDGQTVRVIVEGEKVPEVVAVPQVAIAQDQTGPYLFIVNDKNMAEQRRVKTGAARDGMVAITDGLKAGERVIVQGQQRVRAGMTVNPSLAPSLAPKQ